MKYKISEKLKSLKPYQPGQSEADVKAKYNRESFIKLASNESPMKPFDSVVSALKDSVDKQNIYPDPQCRDLLEVASNYYGVDQSQILAGNGSNELIDLLIRLFCEPGEKVLTSKAAFIAYKVCAQSNRADLIEVDLNSDCSINLENYSKELEKLEAKNSLPKIVFIPNPNNPTGTYIPEIQLDEFMNKWGGKEELIIVVDEAYNEFVDAGDFATAKKYLHFENVVMLKTMSKVFGLAGLRLGFLIGCEELLSYVHRIRNPFNVNALAQVAGAAALKDEKSISEIKRLIISQRASFEDFLKKEDFAYVPSQANFVFFDPGMSALKAHDYFLSQGLIVRPLLPYGFDTQLRVTIGDEAQMDSVKAVFRNFKDWAKTQ